VLVESAFDFCVVIQLSEKTFLLKQVQTKTCLILMPDFICLIM